MIALKLPGCKGGLHSGNYGSPVNHSRSPSYFKAISFHGTSLKYGELKTFLPQNKLDSCRFKEGNLLITNSSENSFIIVEKSDSNEDPMESLNIVQLENTVRLVETAMLAALAGLAYFLSNLLRLESYFGSFFPLPIVISSVRWGASAGRKTMIATALLLFVLSGPLKAVSYLLMHGFVGLAMGAMWRWRVAWPISILVCSVVRCVGLIFFVVLSSWLVRENLLTMVISNAHASLTFMLASLGSSIIPTMEFVYASSIATLLINCLSFLALLHFLYAIFLRRLGISSPQKLPTWLERAL